ncbi:MAG: SMP-30/gluconolaconase/LRE-like region-containing protein [Rhizobacter sp.]|nr:SMP-30/gluconolaconase/LRE-like region-containing protein [Rhizobacter sp.]
MKVDAYSPALEAIVPRSARLDRIAYGLSFGEGPVWDQRGGALYFVDIIASRVHRWTPGVGVETVIPNTGHANGMTFDHEGRLLVAGWSSRTVWRREHDGSLTTLASHFEGKALNTPNDIVVHSNGAIYFTDSDGGLFIPGMEGEDVQRYLDFSGVFRIPPGGGDAVAVLTRGAFPNGLAFSPDESLLYVTDTRDRHISVFDVQADGSLANGRVFYELKGEEVGHADGMKVDVEGNVYCTGPAGIHILSPDGELLGRLHVPADCTNMAWGDDDAKSLYITTFHSVFRVRLKIAGIRP